jgi:hypothetical protein
MKSLNTATQSVSNNPHKNTPSIQVGELFPSNLFGVMEIIDYVNCRNVTVKFTDTGNTKVCATYNIRSGHVADRGPKKTLHQKNTNIDKILSSLSVISGHLESGVLNQDAAQKLSTLLIN